MTSRGSDSACNVCPKHFCYWYRQQPQRCELEITQKYLQKMYQLSRPKVADQEYPTNAHLPSTILKDRPWDMSLELPTKPSNWLGQFLEDEKETNVGVREFPEKHSVICEFCGQPVFYKTRKPVYNVCKSCKLRIVKSREKGDFVDILSKPYSALDSEKFVTLSLPSSRFGPSKSRRQVVHLELAQMAPVDRRGGSGTKGTMASDESLTTFNGKKRVKAALWLREQMRNMGKR